MATYQNIFNRVQIHGEPDPGVAIEEGIWGRTRAFFSRLRETGREFRLDMLVREARAKGWDAAFLAVYSASIEELDRRLRTPDPKTDSKADPVADPEADPEAGGPASRPR